MLSHYMKRPFITCFWVFIGLGLSAGFCPLNAQSLTPETRQVLDYYELKGLLLKHKATVSSLLSRKQFTHIADKHKPESTIHIYKRTSDTTQLLVRTRKTDGRVNEVAWIESQSTLGDLTHDAIADGFVPVNGNSLYQNRFQRMNLLVGYAYAGDATIPCIIRSTK